MCSSTHILLKQPTSRSLEFICSRIIMLQFTTPRTTNVEAQNTEPPFFFMLWVAESQLSSSAVAAGMIKYFLRKISISQLIDSLCNEAALKPCSRAFYGRVPAVLSSDLRTTTNVQKRVFWMWHGRFICWIVCKGYPRWSTPLTLSNTGHCRPWLQSEEIKSKRWCPWKLKRRAESNLDQTDSGHSQQRAAVIIIGSNLSNHHSSLDCSHHKSVAVVVLYYSVQCFMTIMSCCCLDKPEEVQEAGIKISSYRREIHC